MECATNVGMGVRAPPKVVDVQVDIPPAIATSTLDDLELQKFVEGQRNQNTKKKTKGDVSKWYRWCQTVGENRKIEYLPHDELDRLLGHFFVKIRKVNGTEYEPDSLTSFQ